MKKVYFTLILLLSIAEASPSPITSVEIKTSLGKAIINQQKIQANQNILFNQIKELKQEIKKLKKINAAQKDQINSNKLIIMNDQELQNKQATIRAYFANVRSKPSTKSVVVNKYSMCKTINIDNCNIEKNGENWCKVSNNGGYIKNYLLSFSSTMMSTSKLASNHNILITGISLDGNYACLKNEKSIPTQKLNYKKD